MTQRRIQKGDRTRKHTIWMMRAQQPAQKEVMVRHRFINNESNASWLICMYTYLRNIDPLFFIEFSFFSKVWLSDRKLWWLFRSCLLKSYLVILTFERDQHTCFLTNFNLMGCQLPPTFSIFLEGESWSQPFVFVRLPPNLIMSSSVQFGFSLGMRLCGRRFGYLQGVVFMKNFWNFKAILKNHFDVCSKQTCSE
jgi:hypothetical protein